MEAIFHKEERPTLMNRALQQIKAAIRSGRLKPGERIVESTLAEMMQISRFPIREALRQLESEGLVKTVPFKGTSVARFTQRDLEELYSVRGALEELAIRTLIECPNSRQQVVDRLEEVIDNMVHAAASRNAATTVEADLRFHQTVCELADNRKLMAMWRTLESQLRMFITLEEFQYQDLEGFIDGHRHLIHAIRRQDTGAAVEHLRRHLQEGLDIIRRTYLDNLAKNETRGGHRHDTAADDHP